MLRIDDIRWANGDWWPILLLPLVLIPLFISYELFRARLTRSFSGRRLLPRMLVGVSPGRRFAAAACVLIAVELLALAVLRPRAGLKEVSVRGVGVDIAVVLDASRSMKASDVVPDRLTASTVEITRLLRASRGNRWALVPFAGIAFIQSPLTVDTGVLEEYLKELRITDLPVPGTALGRALAVAASSLGVDSEGGNGGSMSKAIVIFTDGENHEGDPEKAAAALAERGIRIFTVGVGTPAGQPIPLVDDNGNVTGTAREADGVTPVMSKLNETLLKDLSARTGGKYLALDGGTDVAAALATEVDGLQKNEYQAQVDRLLEDRFQWPLGAALLFLMAPFLLAGASWRWPRKNGRALMLVLGGMLVAWTPGSSAAQGLSRLFDRDHPDVSDALALLANGQAGDAAKALTDLLQQLPGRPDLLYDLALSREKAGDLDGAVEAATQAIAARTQAREVRPEWPSESKLHYQKGTLLARKAMKQGDEKKPAREIRTTWRQAVEALTRAVILDPASSDARRNLELAASAAYPPCIKLDDHYEPNNTPDKAQFLTLDPNTLEAKEDLLLCPGDSDWFRVPLRDGETLFASVLEPAEEKANATGAPQQQGEAKRTPSKVDIALADADGRVPEKKKKDIRLQAKEATSALLEITGPKEEDGIPYTLEARVVPPCPQGDDGMEPNDSRDAPKPLPDGDHGLRVCPGNDDWFTYTEKQGTRKEISLTVPDQEGPLTLEVFSADGTPLDVRQQTGDGGMTMSSLMPKAEQDAPFTIRVFGGGRQGFYQLSVRDPKGKQDNQNKQQQQQQQQDQQQAGSRTLRELLDAIDRNDDNLEAREAARKSPWKDRVPDKDW